MEGAMTREHRSLNGLKDNNNKGQKKGEKMK